MANGVCAKKNVTPGLEPFLYHPLKKQKQNNSEETPHKQTEPSLLIISCIIFERCLFSQNNIFLMTLYYWKNGCHLVPVEV